MDDIQNMRFMLRCYEAILNDINEGVIATDSEGQIIIYNRQLAEFEGMDQDGIIGKRLMDVYDWSIESSEHMQVLKSGKQINESNYENVSHTGKQTQLVATTKPLIVDGKAVAAYSISRNVAKIREIYNRTIELLPRTVRSDRQGQNGTRFTLEDLVFASRKMDDVLVCSQKAAVSPSPVLICGETGTGKEIVAQGVHNAGKNRAQPFVGLNCAAIPESLLESLLFGTAKGAFTGAEDMAGFFEQAQEGTIYLDEIHSMPVGLQAKLLRVMQEKTFRRIGEMNERRLRCKVLSSVNKDPPECIAEGQLRQDLYYRIGVINISIPPLRERAEDIVPLTEHFTKKYKELYGVKDVRFDDAVLDAFFSYPWPGNIRELEHVIERAISMMDGGGALTLYSLPPYFRKKAAMAACEPPDRFGASRSAVAEGMSAPGEVMPSQATGPAVMRESPAPLTLKEALFAAEKKLIAGALAECGNNVTKAAELLGIGRQNMQYRMKKIGAR